VNQPPPSAWHGPPVAAPPRGPAPVAVQPPAPARPSVDQNRKAIDQLGFRPSH
jgi:hypothetical protein